MTKFWCILLIFLFTACHKPDIYSNSSVEWQKFTYQDYNGFLYICHQNNNLYGILCADVAGIQGRLKISHPATNEQYNVLQTNLMEMGATCLGKIKNPDFSDYPDLSMYLTFVISHDELNDLWKKLGLDPTD